MSTPKTGLLRVDTSVFTETRSPPSSPDNTLISSTYGSSEYTPSNPATSSGSPRGDIQPARSSPAVIATSGFSSIFCAPSVLPAINIHIPLPQPKRARDAECERPRQAIGIAHPYAPLKGKGNDAKRRKIWNHVLEKRVFTAEEIETMKAPQRRPIYVASLEAHIDALHDQLFVMGLYPIELEAVKPWAGLNCKTAQSLVAGLQQDTTSLEWRQRELRRASCCLNAAIIREKQLLSQTVSDAEATEAVEYNHQT